MDARPLRNVSAHLDWTERQRDRIDGGNTYCELRPWNHVRDQVWGTAGGRYTAINGCSWHAHGKLEPRIPASTEDPILGREIVSAVVKSARQSARIARFRHRVTIRAWRDRRFGSYTWPWESPDLMALDRDLVGLVDPEAEPGADDDPDWFADLRAAASAPASNDTPCIGCGMGLDRATCGQACTRGSGVTHEPF